MAQPQHYPQAEIVAWLRAYTESDEPEIEDEREAMMAFGEAVIERFPGLLIADLSAAKNAYDAERAEEDALAEASHAYLHEAVELCQRHGIPPDMPMGDALRQMIADGDPDAVRVLAEFERPERLAQVELFAAAVEVHPAWTREANGSFVQDTTLPGPSDEVGLVDWYQRTHPREAAAITDRIMGGRA